MVFADDESWAFHEVMVNRDTAHIRLSGFDGGRRQIVGLGDLLTRVGGYWKLSGAIFRICRELIESRDAVGRYTTKATDPKFNVDDVVRLLMPANDIMSRVESVSTLRLVSCAFLYRVV
jgi:hypothetical protein